MSKIDFMVNSGLTVKLTESKEQCTSCTDEFHIFLWKLGVIRKNIKSMRVINNSLKCVLPKYNFDFNNIFSIRNLVVTLHIIILLCITFLVYRV